MYLFKHNLVQTVKTVTDPPGWIVRKLNLDNKFSSSWYSCLFLKRKVQQVRHHSYQQEILGRNAFSRAMPQGRSIAPQSWRSAADWGRGALQLPAYRASASGCARLVFFFQAWFLRSPRRGMVGLRQELPSRAPYVSRSA